MNYILIYLQREGGPTLIFDHQMVIDSQNQAIYVFGGKTIAPGGSDHYSGLYKYEIDSKKWTLLRYFPLLPSLSLSHYYFRDESPAAHSQVELRSRIGHCMLFDPLAKKLYIFAGQRCKDYLWYLSVYF